MKKLLHESIKNNNDEAFLQSVKEILGRIYEPEDITLTPYQENRFEETKKSINQGDALTDAQADQLLSKWLNR